MSTLILPTLALCWDESLVQYLLSFRPVMVTLQMLDKNRTGTERAITTDTVLQQWLESPPWAKCLTEKTECLPCQGDTGGGG